MPHPNVILILNQQIHEFDLLGEAAERILAPEPDGSFVVRDSSDHHYIFRWPLCISQIIQYIYLYLINKLHLSVCGLTWTICSLTFKLNGFVRHVRIEHDQGRELKCHSSFSFKQSWINHFF